MTNGSFLSVAPVVTLLAGVALLAMLSALTLTAPDRRGRRHIVAFLGCLVGIWAVADLVLALIGHTN